MEKNKYPAYDAHLALHEEFGNQVAEFMGNGDAWTEDRVKEMRRFLNKWLIGHIMTHDLRFGKWHAAHAASNVSATQAPPKKSVGFLARLFGRKS